MTDSMFENNNRNDYFKKDLNLERSLEFLNSIIKDSGNNILKEKPELPVILIMGCARSGTTLLLQFLAETGNFSYPSNLIARYYKNPMVGLLTQKVLLELDPLNQIGFDLKLNEKFNSNLGKTIGALSPSEYWYFWRQFFKFDENDNLTRADFKGFLKKISAFEIVTNKIPVLKGMIMNREIEKLYMNFPKFIFIHVKRNEIENAVSLLNARRKYFSDIKKWYSFKTLNYEDLRFKDPHEQVIEQVYQTNIEIENQLLKIPSKNKIQIDYSEFCNNPISIYNLIKEKLKLFNYDISELMNKKLKFTDKVYDLNNLDKKKIISKIK